MIKTGKENESTTLHRDLCLAGTSYVYDKRSSEVGIQNLYNGTSSTYEVTIGTLRDYGVVDSQLIDGTKLKGNDKLIFSLSSGELVCEFVSVP